MSFNNRVSEPMRQNGFDRRFAARLGDVRAFESPSSRPLRICQVVPYDMSERGGVKHHAFQLARELRARGDHVTIIGPSTAPIREPNVVVLSGAANFPANGSDNRLGLFVSPLRVRRFFRGNHFDVVHLHEPQLPILPYWALRFSDASAHVATFHAFSETPNETLGFFSRLLAPTQRTAFQVSLAVSDEAAAYARLSWPEPLTIVPNGVPTSVFTPLVGERRPGPIRLLFVGRLGDPRKGFDDLYEAFRRLRARGSDLTLDVVGELGGARPPVAMPGLTYHGPVPMGALVEHYRRCDIFVAPSTGQESFGIVLLEAMATALPVICSDIPGYRRTVTANGARLVPPRDIDALQRAIVELASQPDLRRVMGEANHRRAAMFDWQAVAGRVRDIYLDAIGSRARNGKTAGAVTVA